MYKKYQITMKTGSAALSAFKVIALFLFGNYNIKGGDDSHYYGIPSLQHFFI
jgi:hypothetical protein